VNVAPDFVAEKANVADVLDVDAAGALVMLVSTVGAALARSAIMLRAGTVSATTLSAASAHRKGRWVARITYVFPAGAIARSPGKPARHEMADLRGMERAISFGRHTPARRLMRSFATAQPTMPHPWVPLYVPSYAQQQDSTASGGARRVLRSSLDLLGLSPCPASHSYLGSTSCPTRERERLQTRH
jgi:hypothetical protein